MVSVCSRSMGLVMLLVECRRRGLYQSLIQVAMSRLAWARVVRRPFPPFDGQVNNAGVVPSL